MPLPFLGSGLSFVLGIQTKTERNLLALQDALLLVTLIALSALLSMK